MGSFEKIFSSMAERNQGKMGLLAGGDLQKNLGNFWEGITRIREALGGMILLAVAGGWILDGTSFLGSKDMGLAVLVGLLATPLAPIAKDLSSALGAAVNAMQIVQKKG